MLIIPHSSRGKTAKIPPFVEGGVPKGRGMLFSIQIFSPSHLETIPLYPPLLRGKVGEIPPSLEGGRGDVSTASPL